MTGSIADDRRGKPNDGEWLVPPLRALIPVLLGHRVAELEDLGLDPVTESRGTTNAESELELLPYSLDAAYAYVIELAEVQRTVLERAVAKPTAHPRGHYQQLSTGDYRVLSFTLDSYLDAARRAQDATTRLLRVALRGELKRELPKSLNDLVKETRAVGLINCPIRFGVAYLSTGTTTAARV